MKKNKNETTFQDMFEVFLRKNLTDEDCKLEGIRKVSDKVDSMNEKLDNYLVKRK